MEAICVKRSVGKKPFARQIEVERCDATSPQARRIFRWPAAKLEVLAKLQASRNSDVARKVAATFV
jgi:hypothetical protein